MNPLTIILSLLEEWGDEFPQLFTPFSSFRPVKTAFENFKFLLDVNTSIFLLLSLPCLLCKSTPYLESGQGFLGRSFRDLPWGWMVMSGAEYGREWASFRRNSLLQWFGSSPLNEYKTLFKLTECCTAWKMLWQLQRGEISCSVLGPGNSLLDTVQY